MPEPKVRFIRDDGASFPAWKTLPMSEVFIEISEKNHPEMPVLSIQQGVGTILRDSSDRNILYDKSNLKNYKVMRKGDYIIHLRSFEGGLECSNHDGISSPAYRILRPQTILSAAYRDYFRSYEFIHNKLAISVVGIRDGKNIDMETFWQIPMAVPCLEEQQKIADFLSSVDEVIAASEEEVVNLETQKKAVMKKLFSREVRFKREDGSDFLEWEEMNFDQLADYKKGPFGSALKKELFVPQSDDTVKVYEQQNAIGKDWKLERYFITAEYARKMKGFEVHSGDIIISCAGTIGEIYELPVGAEPGIINQALMRVRVDETVINKYYFSCVFDMMITTEGSRISNGSALKNIPPFADLKKQVVSIPCLEEQRLIADFLSNFDEAIAAAKKELELWKELKKGLLQQMFV